MIYLNPGGRIQIILKTTTTKIKTYIYIQYITALRYETQTYCTKNLFSAVYVTFISARGQ